MGQLGDDHSGVSSAVMEMALTWAWYDGEGGRNRPHSELMMAESTLLADGPGRVRKESSETF